MIARTAHFVWRITYARYIMASGAALAADLSLFFTMMHMNADPVAAAVTGYCAGLIVHWMISSRLVFREFVRPFAAQRRKQKALFVASTLVGLALTTLIVGMSDTTGLDPRIAKLIACGVSFQATYLLRRKVVFA
ncbi:MAG: GtrA family protein [Sphingobium sp.]